MATELVVKSLTIVLCVVVAIVSCQDELVPINATNAFCLNQMVKWCDDMKYPQQGENMAMLSASYGNETSFYRVYCYSDNQGTNCTRNGQPWFTCTRVDDKNNTFTYKEQVPTADSVDDDICPTADKALDDLFVQNLSFDNDTVKSALDKSMEAFFNQMAMMEEQIEQLTRRLNLLFGGFDPFGGGGFLPDDPLWLLSDNSTDQPMTNIQTESPELTTETVKVIEREQE